MPNCRYCGKPITHNRQAKVCRDPECQRQRKRDNHRMEEARRRERRGLAREAAVPGSCRYCGAPLTHSAARVCHAKECQKRRQKENNKRFDERHRPVIVPSSILRIRECIICGQPFVLKPTSKRDKKVCYRRECAKLQRQQSLSNLTHLQDRLVEVECLKCGRIFRTERVGQRKLPHFRTCGGCREKARDEYRFVEAWN